MNGFPFSFCCPLFLSVFLLLSSRGPLHTPLSRHLPSFICPPLLSPSHSLLSVSLSHSHSLLSFTLPLSLSHIYLSLSPSHSVLSIFHSPPLLSIFHSPPLILPLLHTLLVLFPKSPKSRGSKHKSRRKSKKLREPSTVCSPFLQCHVGGGGEERGGVIYILYLPEHVICSTCNVLVLVELNYSHTVLSPLLIHFITSFDDFLSFLLFSVSYYKRKYGNASLYFFFFFSFQ